jgi:protein SCO1/2
MWDNSPMMQRATMAAAVVAAAIAGAFTAYLVTREPARPVLERATLFDDGRPLPAPALVDHLGRDFGLDRLRGRWTLLFFGFTHCPDVCPLTLATLAEARRLLAGLPPPAQPAVAFVSVDPRRDTAAALSRYVGHFDPEFTGVTGGAAAIESFTRALGVAVVMGAPGEDGSYTVDHTAAVFLVNPQAELVAVFGAPHEAAIIAEDYRRIVTAGRG